MAQGSPPRRWHGARVLRIARLLELRGFYGDDRDPPYALYDALRDLDGMSVYNDVLHELRLRAPAGGALAAAV